MAFLRLYADEKCELKAECLNEPDSENANGASNPDANGGCGESGGTLLVGVVDTANLKPIMFGSSAVNVCMTLVRNYLRRRG